MMRPLVTLLWMSALASCTSMKAHRETMHAIKLQRSPIIGERRWTSTPDRHLPDVISDQLREEAAAMQQEMQRIQEQADAVHP